MMRQLKAPKFVALAFVSIVVAAGCVFGVAGDTARATVIESGFADRRVRLLDPAARASTPPRGATINGGRVEFQVATTRRSVPELIALYRDRYAAEVDPSELGLDSGAVAARPAEERAALTRLFDVITALGRAPYYAWADEQRGVFAAAQLPGAGGLGWPFRLMDPVRAFLADGTLDGFDEPVVLAAFAEPHADRTTFVQVVPQLGFKPMEVTPSSERDCRGSDPPWFQRPPGAVRLVSFAEDGPVSTSRVTAYGSPAPLGQVVGDLQALGVEEMGASTGGGWMGRRSDSVGGQATVSVTQGRQAFETTILVVEGAEAGPFDPQAVR